MSLIVLFTFIISNSLCVKSSSILCELSCLTEGRTAGGGTGNTEHINHSGRHQVLENPIYSESSSVIFSKIDLTCSTFRSCVLISDEFVSLISNLVHFA